MSTPPRVAFFTDSFHEVNGVALTSQQLEGFARRRGYPFFSCHTGPATQAWQEDSVTRCELALGAGAIPLESDLRFDIAFLRHRRFTLDAVRAFRPDLIHVTGPSHIGILGLLLARKLRLPLVASWHTNVHEFGGRRLERLLNFLPEAWSDAAGRGAESGALAATIAFYRLANMLLAPNQGLIDMLEARTGRKCFLMRRGVDSERFHPARRDRASETLVLGYIGRVSPEKNVAYLVDVERALRETALRDYRFFVAGHGSQLEWLRDHLVQAEIHGVLTGEALERAHANLDVFVFPSETDTFGNVVQEAMASGVPAVVTDQGGPAYIVTHGHDGLVAPIGPAFLDAVLRLALDPVLRRELAANARRTALSAGWDAVFEEVYAAYAHALAQPVESR